MKKIFAIMILLAGVMTFTSCGDEPTADNPLIGTWTLDYSAPDASDKDEYQSTIKFSKNMTYEWKEKWNFAPDDRGSHIDKGTYEVDVYNGYVRFKSSTDYGTWGWYFEIEWGNHLCLDGEWYIRK